MVAPDLANRVRRSILFALRVHRNLTIAAET